MIPRRNSTSWRTRWEDAGAVEQSERNTVIVVSALIQLLPEAERIDTLAFLNQRNRDGLQ